MKIFTFASITGGEGSWDVQLIKDTTEQQFKQDCKSAVIDAANELLKKDDTIYEWDINSEVPEILVNKYGYERLKSTGYCGIIEDEIPEILGSKLYRKIVEHTENIKNDIISQNILKKI